jgi:hypothetical protein
MVEVCPICSKTIRNGEPVGNVEGKAAHLDCWMEWKRGEGASRTPDRTR